MRGSFELCSLLRLKGELSNEESTENNFAEVELAFERDKLGYASASGFVKARVGMVCQRCLGVVPSPLDAAVNWVFIKDKSSFEDAPKTYDVIIVEDEAVSLFDLIEEELLLALPPIPMHEEGECRAPDHQPQSKGFAESSEVKRSPFELLAGIKKKNG
ncbi:MAG: DUF177 domain-containing protein [Pseudomonadales bacterium]|nr:DUF177 domain-containing protein [Pseudomonadales bacterium]